MSEMCPKCGINKGELAGYGKDRRPIYYPHDPGDIQCRFNQKDARIAALTQRAEQAEAWQNRAINSAKQIATVECIDGVWWAKCRHGGLYGPQATEREVWLEVAEMRLAAAEAEVKRLREGIRKKGEELRTGEFCRMCEHMQGMCDCKEISAEYDALLEVELTREDCDEQI